MMSFKNIAISETGFVFDPKAGATFTANATAVAVLQALRDDVPFERVPERLAERFEGVTAFAREDIKDFVSSLCSFGLVSAEFATHAVRDAR